MIDVIDGIINEEARWDMSVSSKSFITMYVFIVMLSKQVAVKRFDRNGKWFLLGIVILKIKLVEKKGKL